MKLLCVNYISVHLSRTRHRRDPPKILTRLYLLCFCLYLDFGEMRMHPNQLNKKKKQYQNRGVAYLVSILHKYIPHIISYHVQQSVNVFIIFNRSVWMNTILIKLLSAWVCMWIVSAYILCYDTHEIKQFCFFVFFFEIYLFGLWDCA